MREFVRKHKRKIFLWLSALILFFVVSPTFLGELVTKRATLFFAPDDGSFSIGDTISIDVMVESPNLAINVVGATLYIPNDQMEIVSVSNEDSIITLWVEEPSFSNKFNIVKFSGGTTREGGFRGSGKVATIVVRATRAGRAEIQFVDATVFAHDGKGTPVLDMASHARYMIRDIQPPSPDLNGDGSIDFSDVGILFSRFGLSYDVRYDLNQDGGIGVSDFSVLFSAIGEEE